MDEKNYMLRVGRVNNTVGNWGGLRRIPKKLSVGFFNGFPSVPEEGLQGHRIYPMLRNPQYSGVLLTNLLFLKHVKWKASPSQDAAFNLVTLTIRLYPFLMGGEKNLESKLFSLAQDDTELQSNLNFSIQTLLSVCPPLLPAQSIVFLFTLLQ